MTSNVPASEPVSTGCPLNISREDLVEAPFPHIIKDGFLRDDLYRRLVAEFPRDEQFDAASTVGARSGRDLYPGDPGYDELLGESPAWRELKEWIDSKEYVDLVMDLFGPYMREFDCAIDPSQASYVPFVEPRDVMKKRSRLAQKFQDVKDNLSSKKTTNDIFVRMDIAQGGVGYKKGVHCDRPNRVTTMLVYLCDAEENEQVGGDLHVHKPVEAKPYRSYSRHPQDSEVEKILDLRPAHNRGVFFLCTNNSYHSVDPVISQKNYRNYIYTSASSHAPVIW